jgi:hypothetical protein
MFDSSSFARSGPDSRAEERCTRRPAVATIGDGFARLRTANGACGDGGYTSATVGRRRVTGYTYNIYGGWAWTTSSARSWPSGLKDSCRFARQRRTSGDALGLYDSLTRTSTWIPWPPLSGHDTERFVDSPRAQGDLNAMSWRFAEANGTGICLKPLPSRWPVAVHSFALGLLQRDRRPVGPVL